MEFEIILNSRTYSVDYRWIARPDYISDALCDRVRDLMYLLERAGNLTNEDYLRNIFFFTDESGGVLVRGGYSATADKFGRQIYSVEGIACPAAKLRDFWYAIPALISWMTQCPLFRDTWLYGIEEGMDLSGLRVGIPELDAEDKKNLMEESGLFDTCAPHVQKCLQFLQKDVLAAEEVFPLAFVPGDSQLYLDSLCGNVEKEAVERIYTKRTVEQMQELTPVRCVPFTEAEIEDDSFHIEVTIARQKDQLTAMMSAMDRNGREIAYLDTNLGKGMEFYSSFMELSRLESAAQQLRDEVLIYGYCKEV